MLHLPQQHHAPSVAHSWKTPSQSSSMRARKNRIADGWLRQLIATMLVCIGTTAWAEEAETEQPFEFDIPQQAADLALTEFAEQADLTLVFPDDLVQGKLANKLIGRYTLQDGIDLLLAGTGLNPTFSNKIVLSISTDERSANEGETMNIKKKAGLLAVLASLFTGGAAAQEPANTDDAEKALEEIIVVGTQIRGAAPAGANVITIDREAIKLGGFSTTQEVLQSIPQNFGGGANEDVTNTNPGESTGDRSFASSINLRGLGTESTLSLINGRRTAPGGAAGGFVDLNFIPASAIERVEVLPDGASAIYGSDAVAGVINVILRDDYEGAETRLRYAPGTSDIDEIQFSQVFGKKWDTGNVLFTYEYYDRSELKSVDRAYARDSDQTSFGGSDSSSSISNPGNITRYTSADGSRTTVLFPIPSGQDGTSLTPADLITGASNRQNIRQGTTILPSQERNSAYLLLSQELSSSIELFADIRYSNRDYENRNTLLEFSSLTVPNTNAFFVDLDPLGGSTDLRIQYSFVDDYGSQRQSGDVESLGGTLGATFSLGNTWELEAYGSHNTEDTLRFLDRRPNTALLALALADGDPATAFNPFGDGSNTNPATLAAIEGFDDTRYESELTLFNLTATGDLFDAPGGPAKMAIGAQFRDQSLGSLRLRFTSTPDPVVITSTTSTFSLERDVTAAFAELYLPLVFEQNARPGIKELALSIAGRYEDYSDFGDTFDPKLGVTWSPTDSLSLRGTIGTSFRAPLLTELNASQPVFQAAPSFPDVGSPTGTSAVLFRSGASATLIPEEGTTWTVGFDIAPASLPGFKVGMTYFSTEIDNLIAVPTNSFFDALNQPENFAPIIFRVPDDIDVATVQSFLDEPICLSCGLLTADEVDVVVDLRLNNLTRSEVSGLDLDLAYAFETDIGSFNVQFYASYLFELNEQPFTGSALEDQLDTIGKPTTLKLRGNLTWSNGGAHAAIFGNHIGDYTSARSAACRATAAGFCPVSSWTTWDLNLGYEFGENRFSGLLEGTGISLNVQNLFDKDPPFVDLSGFGVGYDPVNANPWGQFLSLQLIKEW